MRKRRGEDADQAVQIARPHAEIVDVPAEQPGAEPSQPDADHQSGGAEHCVSNARAIAAYRMLSGLGRGQGDVHRFSMGALSWALVAVRDIIPDFFTVILANALLSIGYALLVDAVRRFAGRAPGSTLLFALVGINIAVQVFFTYEIPSTRLRILFGSLLFA